MKVGKILLYVLIIGAIASQLYAILMKTNLSDEFTVGFITGKVIIILIVLIIGRFAIKAMNQRIS